MYLKHFCVVGFHFYVRYFNHFYVFVMLCAGVCVDEDLLGGTRATDVWIGGFAC